MKSLLQHWHNLYKFAKNWKLENSVKVEKNMFFDVNFHNKKVQKFSLDNKISIGQRLFNRKLFLKEQCKTLNSTRTSFDFVTFYEVENVLSICAVPKVSKVFCK